ncbi:MAG: UDP-N-acetylmuramoyl-L-alanyl-D-glutamate--2,6-diaminopimelate ligase [Alloprevotella sp.]|nr:UDP-N-acetylmuramoyl-L-alanyl-D-glutamate--2,6-diaminopimelate ligase [Prevotellamassilia sp.]MCI6144052.1 UDP-N-acetylmuramoyl-L-alanyl-D-glutamate--2,6-diaminopimelate ligase [Bacteroidales bacterium]MDY2779054.1 UDP-N-acetylmuramoyl-L-alanyl-D-glutamate--2,6-diaminopimelate ligase [Alloprevotella sp.]MDD7564190.1 UDP-N-acetylmuramoyl-L-alanyl-D-glutamate--2,6-diaminopimelate ligase [Prevotellamassilia sp.]MDY4568102.1 UDP-N-acetylmuramoyl-L-alanyl-D-glutamate--2,6-diaminopimelate ligase [
MQLSEVLKKVTPLEVCGDSALEISGVNMDSRLVKSGNLFIAVKGTQADGHAFIGKALDNGAVAVVMSNPIPAERPEGVTFVRVADTEDAVGKVATQFYGDPTSHLKLVGVTGTNGKTTIATLLYNMFRKMGFKCGLCSTVCNYIDGEAVPTEHTTPDPITLNALLARMVEAGCDYAFMECSSHAIHQKRIGGLAFAGGIFTNLTRDHLDYHKTFENYRDAKKAFFDNLPAGTFAITNADDKNGLVMTQNTKATVKTYSTRTAADYKGRILEESIEGMLLDMDGSEVSVRFVGRFNVSNLLAVYGAAVMLGQSREEVLRVLSTLNPVNGRFEAIRSPKGFSAVIDYAHTPDALANVLTAIGEIVKGKGQVITVCGAGGNRDKGKRPLMAQEAANRSDRVIITSDNPRFEEPQDIINDMLAGLDADQMAKTISIADRREAIRAAAMMAREGDVILVAGKGHEPYQEIKGVKHHFDDHEEVRAAFGLA